MIDTMVIATDGSESVRRAVNVACDLADRFEADVHALYVVEAGEVDNAPSELKDRLRNALQERGQRALGGITDRFDAEITTAVREGRPAQEITKYARDIDADVVATGTRGRHGENRFLVGSVAERVVRSCPAPVLTVRQLREEAEA